MPLAAAAFAFDPLAFLRFGSDSIRRGWHQEILDQYVLENFLEARVPPFVGTSGSSHPLQTASSRTRKFYIDPNREMG
ncbi:MAG: hypothetical protein KF762_15245 [Acidobacteria bacterium]|nr:hypothetical protein [Acidobacteriota bacterium]